MNRSRIYCEVCRKSFIYRGEAAAGQTLICPICGASLEIIAVQPQITARRTPQAPRDEITNRVQTFAQLRGYVLGEDSKLIIDGLLEKNKRFGDFYCPCRFDNIPENICPCLETRMNQVRKDGHCL